MDSRKVLNAAVAVAQDAGFCNLTHGRVAERLGVTRQAIPAGYKIDQLKRDVMRRAIRDRIFSILEVGLLDRNPDVLASGLVDEIAEGLKGVTIKKR